MTSAGAIAITSKLPSRRSKNEFYRYYAGYPLDFAEWALRELRLSNDALILDPWNGSGTTAAACARLRVSCKGYDINPVMVHLGRARVASNADFDEAAELIDLIEVICATSISQRSPSRGRRFRDAGNHRGRSQRCNRCLVPFRAASGAGR